MIDFCLYFFVVFSIFLWFLEDKLVFFCEIRTRHKKWRQKLWSLVENDQKKPEIWKVFLKWSPRGKWVPPPLKDQSSGEKVAIFVDIRKVHEKSSIFCFYGIFWIVVVFEVIAFEILNLCTCFRCNTQRIQASTTSNDIILKTTKKTTI